MSGGSMDYVYCEINNACREVQRALAEMKLRQEKGIFPVATGHHESKELSVRTIKHLEDALLTMRRAAIYAQRVEWWTSDDDDEQSFCERLEKQLSEAEKTGGVE